jgi:polyketide cyclase/dehydrase/lipid transport protein
VARYSFLTTWALGAPAEVGRVFDALHDPVAYPSWWKGVQAVERLEEGDADGVGALDRYVWKSKLPYELEFRSRTVRVERPYLMEGEAFGELEGTGRWRLWENPAGICVTYEWQVGTTAPWMNLLAPIAKPVFAWNHDYVMRNGGEGLARLVGAPLLLSD